MHEIRRLALFHVIACLCSALNRNRAVFEEQPDGDITVKQEGTMTNLFHKRFHQCSIDKECNYVVHYINTNEYRQVGKQSQLPFDREGCKIWKKMSLKEQLEGRAKDLKNSDVSVSSSKRTSASTSLKVSYALSSRTTTNKVNVKTLGSSTTLRESISLTGSTNMGAGVQLSMTLSLSFKSTKSSDVSSSSITVLKGKSKQYSASVIHLASSSEPSKIARIDNNISSSRTSEMQQKVGPGLSLLTNAVAPTPSSTTKIADISKHNIVASTNSLESQTAVREINTASVLANEPLALGISHTGSSLHNSIRPSPFSTPKTANVNIHSLAASTHALKSQTAVPGINTDSVLAKEPLGISHTGSSLQNSIRFTPPSTAKIADTSKHNNVASTNALKSPTTVPGINTASVLVKQPLSLGRSHTGSSLSDSLRPTPLSTARIADVSKHNNVASTNAIGSAAAVPEMNIASAFVKERLTPGVSHSGSSSSSSVRPTSLKTVKKADVRTSNNEVSTNLLGSPMPVSENKSNSIVSSTLVTNVLPVTVGPAGSLVSIAMQPPPSSTAKTADISKHKSTASKNTLRSPMTIPETNSNSITSSVSVQETLIPTGSSLSNPIRPTPLSTEKTVDTATHSNAASTNVLRSKMAVLETNSNSITSSAPAKQASTLEVDLSGPSLSNLVHHPVSTIRSSDINTRSNAASKNVLRSKMAVLETNSNSITSYAPGTEASALGVKRTGSSLSSTIQSSPVSKLESSDISRYNKENAHSSRTAVAETRKNGIASSGPAKEASVSGVKPTEASWSNSTRLASLQPEKSVELDSGKILRSASIITSTPATAEISSISMSPSQSATETASARVDPASSSSSNVMQPTTAFIKASSVMSQSTTSMLTPLFSLRNEESSVSISTSAMLLHASKHRSKATGMSVLSTNSSTLESQFTISFTASRSIGVSGFISSSSDQILNTASFGLITIDQTKSRLSTTASQLTLASIPAHSFKSLDIAGVSTILQGNSSVLAGLTTTTEKLMISQIRSGVVEATPTSASMSKSALSSSKDARALRPSSSLLFASFSIATKILSASEMPNAMIEATETRPSVSTSVKSV